MNCARNYENVLNFVKVMPKVLLVTFFLDTVYTSDNMFSVFFCLVIVSTEQLVINFQNFMTFQFYFSEDVKMCL